MGKNCIVYLIKNDPEHISNFNSSIASVAKHLKRTLDSGTDLILFLDHGFDKNALQLPTGITTFFELAPFDKLPDGLQQNQVSEYFPHPTHSNGPLAWGDPGFSIGYRHMCRFYSGGMYDQKIFENYSYYLRLDCDSRFLSDVPYCLFEFAARHRLIYGFIDEATQVDDFRVSMGFTQSSRAYVREGKNLFQILKSYFLVKRNGMYYTNLELGYLPWFRSKTYMSYFRHLDSLFGFHLYRWGDAIVKYFAVRTFLPARSYRALRGFVYQHGAVYQNEQFLWQRLARRFKNLSRVLFR